jgi:hypothetical protein
MISKLIFDHYPLQTKNLPRDWTVGSIGQIATFVASGFPYGQHNQDRKGVRTFAR